MNDTTLMYQVIADYWRKREDSIMAVLKDYFGTVSVEELKARVEIHEYPTYEEWLDKENRNVIMRIKKPEIELGGLNVNVRY